MTTGIRLCRWDKMNTRTFFSRGQIVVGIVLHDIVVARHVGHKVFVGIHTSDGGGRG
jgi:hypothetical protein